MAHTGVIILIFGCLNAIECGEASSKFRAAVSSPWYCHRLLPAYITSAVTPCTYPCLLLSPYEHPRIVVYPEPDGMPCRITTTMDHHFKAPSELHHKTQVGKCRGSVCHVNAPHATLKRKKRFLCLYSLVKLIMAKRRLRELKEVIKQLEQQVATSSSGNINSLGVGGTGASGISSGGSAPGGGLNIGIPVTGGSGSSTGGIPVRENTGVIRGSDFGDVINSPNGAIIETGGSNAGTRRFAAGTSSGRSSIGIGNSGSGRTRGTEISHSHHGSSDFGSAGVSGRVGGNAAAESVASSVFSGGTSSIGVGNGGIGLGGSGMGGTSSGSVGIGFSGGSAVEIATRGGSGRGISSSSVMVNGASSSNDHSVSINSRLTGGFLGGSLGTINSHGEGMSVTGSASNNGFPSGFGGNNMGEADLNRPSGTTVSDSNLADSVGNIAAAGSSAVSTISSSNSGVSTMSRSGSSNSERSFSRP